MATSNRSTLDVGRSTLDVQWPRWLVLLRSLFSGLYTVDNMDFVLRDAYMSGYSTRAFDLERLLHYSFFTEQGLTIHARGLSALVRFIGVRAELFRTIYFHRTVRAIDLTLQDLFAESKEQLFPGNPLEHLDEYQQFTESSLLVDVARWDGATTRQGASWRPPGSGSCGARCAGRWPASGRGSSSRKTPSGAASSAAASSSSRPCATCCRGTCASCRCGSIWPGTSTGPARAARRPGRTSSTTPPAV